MGVSKVTKVAGIGAPGPGCKSFQLGQGRLYLPFYSDKVLISEKKLYLALGGAPVLRVPVPVTLYLLSVPDSQCEKLLAWLYPVLITMALPPTVCEPNCIPNSLDRPGLCVNQTVYPIHSIVPDCTFCTLRRGPGTV